MTNTKASKSTVRATTKKSAVKAKPKAGGRAKSAPAAKPVAQTVKPAAPTKTNFMWALLERKEAELKRRAAARAQYQGEFARFTDTKRRGA